MAITNYIQPNRTATARAQSAFQNYKQNQSRDHYTQSQNHQTSEVNEEYVAVAQKRVGIDVDDPSMLTDTAQRGLAAFTDGGEQR